MSRESQIDDSLLLAAARSGDMQSVAQLLQQNSDAISHEGKTEAFIAAAYGGYLPLLKLLLAAGIDVNRPSAAGRSALLDAIEALRLDVVKYLLDNGADVNFRSWNGWTPLHVAVEIEADTATQSQTAPVTIVTELILLYGPKVNAVTDDGLTPLDIALTMYHDPAAELLRAYGAIEGKSTP